MAGPEAVNHRQAPTPAPAPERCATRRHMEQRRPLRAIRGPLEPSRCGPVSRLARSRAVAALARGGLRNRRADAGDPRAMPAGEARRNRSVGRVPRHGPFADREPRDVARGKCTGDSAAGRRGGRVVSGLALNFVPNTALGLAEMRRVVGPGGTIAAYVWDYAGKMELMRHFWDAAVELDPKVRDLDEGVRFRCASRLGWSAHFAKPISWRSKSFRSTFPSASATSTTTGRLSWADRGPPPLTPCPWTTRRAIA